MNIYLETDNNIESIDDNLEEFILPFAIQNNEQTYYDIYSNIFKIDDDDNDDDNDDDDYDDDKIIYNLGNTNLSNRMINFDKLVEIISKDYKLCLFNREKYESCWCCKNYLIIHEKNEYEFIKRYIKKNDENKKNDVNKKNNDNKKYNSLLIKILYRLKPEIFNFYDIKKIKYLDNINLIQDFNINRECLNFSYEIYFNPFEISYEDLFSCTICLNKFCEKHISFNKFFEKKCVFCNKFWYICSWCKYDILERFFNIDYSSIKFEDILCSIYH